MFYFLCMLFIIKVCKNALFSVPKYKIKETVPAFNKYNPVVVPPCSIVSGHWYLVCEYEDNDVYRESIEIIHCC